MTFQRWGSRNKYRNVRIESDGRSFASKLEHSVYEILKLREKAGEISDIQCQVSIRMYPFDIRWIPDFTFVDSQTKELIYCEAKGLESDRFVVIKKIWRIIGPAKLEIWKGTCKNPKLVETIVPSGDCLCRTQAKK
jgi:hypothetical protein